MAPASEPEMTVGQSGGKPLWTAIILAGQRPEGDPMAAYCNVRFKALIPIHGQTMLERVARALLASPDIGRIVVMGQSPEALKSGLAADLAGHDSIAFVESSDGIATSVHNVVGTAIAPWPVLVTTADNALLNGAILDSSRVTPGRMSRSAWSSARRCCLPIPTPAAPG